MENDVYLDKSTGKWHLCECVLASNRIASVRWKKGMKMWSVEIRHKWKMMLICSREDFEDAKTEAEKALKMWSVEKEIEKLEIVSTVGKEVKKVYLDSGGKWYVSRPTPKSYAKAFVKLNKHISRWEVGIYVRGKAVRVGEMVDFEDAKAEAEKAVKEMIQNG